MKGLLMLVALTLAALGLAGGVYAEEASPAAVHPPGAAPVSTAEWALAAPATMAATLASGGGGGGGNPSPPTTCPGQFDINRFAPPWECHQESCNQWCIEDGGNYSLLYSDIWIYPGICICRCCI